MGVFQKYLRLDKVGLAEVLSRFVQLGLVIFFVRQDFGFLFIVSALTAGAAVNFFLILFFVQKHISVRLQFDFSFWLELLRQSLPLGLAAILTMIYFKLDTIMLSLMKTQAEVGIYGLAYKILESLIFFPAMFVGLVMPLMSKYAFLNKEEFKKIVQKTLDVLLILIIPLIVGTFFLSSKIIVLIGGRDFIPSSGVLNILILATGIIFLGALFSNMLISLERQKTLVYIYGAGTLVNVLLNFVFIPKYSYYGAAATTVFTELLVTVLMLWVLRRAIKELPSFGLFYKCLFAALIMALLLYFSSGWNLLISVVLAALIYFSALYLIGGLPIREFAQIYQKSPKSNV
ncbi:MAG: hypothetical protein A3E90_02290 [Candidatus Portnoybacteria bacterium RIFCSPHIGHO2_12_FULL_40_11]|nr:MAG: hypothetical protein A3E90_02290 [Candidatus Portnoybacteria bacterium RIFCSPHIGHO2_12_FULL_40_11]